MISQVAISILPVLIFLISLYFLDSYQLVKIAKVILTIAIGIAVAFIALSTNTILIDKYDINPNFYSRYIAPIVEEIIKALYLFYLIKIRKVGFMVDTAIYGCALGVGFAFTENIFYIYNLYASNLFVWIIRGFGTALMHCGTTALLGIISIYLYEIRQKKYVAACLLGLAFAIILHSLFNHFIVSPVISTILLVIILPLLMITIFKRSEDFTRKWLGTGLDSDLEILQLIMNGNFSKSKIGLFLQALKSHFPSKTVGDLLCYIRLHTELGMRAKGMLLLRESGFDIRIDSDIKEKLIELKFLEKSIGKTGKLAISPILHRSGRSIWQIYFLKQ